MQHFLRKEKLYLDDKIIKKNPDKIIEKIKFTPHKVKAVLVCMTATDHNQLEILKSKSLKQKYYEKNPVVIVGIAFDMEGAKNLVLNICQDALDELGVADMKGYLKPWVEDEC